jgi:aromatic-L-amino-acid/L-tryptophan decarboxylase
MAAGSDHMTPEEFRLHGEETLDWVASYLARIESFPVLPKIAPGEVRSSLPASPPEVGQPFDRLLADLDRVVLPGITHWQSPNFFAYFPANSSGPSVLGDLVASGLGVQGMLWATSPACTELETHMMDWLVELLGLPERYGSGGLGGGVIQDSASSATLTAAIAARERATAGTSNATGVRQPLTVYASRDAHSSVEKAVRVAGIGSDNLRLVDTDASLAMRADELQRLIEADLATGAIPSLVVATVGTTSTMAVDPVRRVGEVCAKHGIWLHVDAAMAGTAAVCPEYRWINDGIELADSYAFNAHKWMLTNFDCDAFFVADRRALVSALSILPEYLRNPATLSGEVIDYRDWQIPLGRRFRALKLWFVIRHYGRQGIQRHVRHHVELAQEFSRWIEDDERFELAAPVNLSLVCFRHRGGDEANERLLEAINSSGIYLTHTKVDGRVTLRLAIGSTLTERRHVEQAWSIVRACADAMGS